MKTRRSARKGDASHKKSLRYFTVVGAFVAVSVAVYGVASLQGQTRIHEPGSTSEGGTITFTDARLQAAEFISYDRSIALTDEQKRIMDTALSSIPAPCCNRYSIATCCCPCNLAKSTWGLAKLLITRHQASATQVKSAALQWLQFTNPSGYTGDACFTGGCERAFERNGCGGMHEDRIG